VSIPLTQSGAGKHAVRVAFPVLTPAQYAALERKAARLDLHPDRLAALIIAADVEANS
jgi:hypothetical protein